ncbi:cytosol aminopeptidase-like isoform X2 [Planococcus citri]|uniref:cytosol aminopeptidase-like isoform X2 n=1 Tax=Planococcus citri TaxID=170843 RepID=UPI0031F7277C
MVHFLRIAESPSLHRVSNQCFRYLATEGIQCRKGLVLGVHCNEKDELKFTQAAETYDKQVSGKLQQHLNIVKSSLKPGSAKVFYSLCSNYDGVALVGLPKDSTNYDALEEINEKKESIRIAAAAGCRSLQAHEFDSITTESFNDSEAAAEGSHLGVWKFQEFKNKEKVKSQPRVSLLNGNEEDWKIGCIKADAQNVARRLADMPSNKMTPSIFANVAEKLLSPCGIEVKIHHKDWILNKKMEAFYSVAKGSTEPPVFLELKYQHGPKNSKPIVFVGKGVTFDSGGISLKPSASMDEMRADMGGAACVLATMLSVAQLELPINFIGLIPLCENMPSGMANKPGDIVTAMNGKTIQIDNTDAEGRLILADALCYAASFDPKFTLDIATLTGAMRVALGGVATGVFSNSNELWKELSQAGAYTGDRVWRFPLWKCYSKNITEYPAVDVNNVGKGKGGGACTAAAFLKEFSPPGDWLHLDIAGVMGPKDDLPYLHSGMTGRPTRTLTQFLMQLSEKK